MSLYLYVYIYLCMEIPLYVYIHIPTSCISIISLYRYLRAQMSSEMRLEFQAAQAAQAVGPRARALAKLRELIYCARRLERGLSTSL